ncbi:MAG: hypothetical protein GXP45_06415 [bacterium]|nr:hypothetical protein [bacterium]
MWQEDLNPFLDTMKKNYFHNYPQDKPALINKVKHKISIKEAKQYLNQKVRVLLYELSFSHQDRQISCKENCSFVADQKIFVATGAKIKLLSPESYQLQLPQQTIIAQNISVHNSENLITIDNYLRHSYYGIPWNSFHGSLIFGHDLVYDKKDKTFIHHASIVNVLDFDDYLKGVVETNDNQHRQKNLVMAMIAKSYMLFYMDSGNINPNIPVNAHYNAIDDPDLFQKYVGA